jgi:hypothetical protein
MRRELSFGDKCQDTVYFRDGGDAKHAGGLKWSQEPAGSRGLLTYNFA